MKTSTLPLYIFTATLFALPALAGTGTAPDKARPERGQMGPMTQEMIKLYDKDGDGKISEDEKVAARAEMRKEGGGRPGRKGPGGGKMREEALKRFDKDGDGKLNEAERAEAEKFREERMKNGGPGDGRMREEALKRFDKDGDGKLSEAERAEAEKAREEMRKKRSGGQ